MDVESSRVESEGSRPRAFPAAASDKKELAWAFVSLILWSGVVLTGVFGVGYVIGHAILHWW